MITNTLPHGFSIRRPIEDDAKAITEMRIACDIADYGEPDSTEEALRAYWRHVGIRLDTDAWLITASDGQFVCYGRVRHDEPTHMTVFHWVHPDYRAHGLSTYFLQLAEERARECIPDAPPDARITLFSMVSEANPTAIQSFEQQGFVAVRYAWRMAIDLHDTPPTPVWPEGVTMRTFVLGQDEFDTYTVENEAFRDHWGYNARTFEQWKQNVVGSVHFDSLLTFLAYEGKEPAGIALCEEWLGIGNVNTLGVRSSWRKKGLGLALLYSAFGAFYQRGITQVKLYVDTQNLTGATRLYERAGMHAEKLVYEFEKELRPGKETAVR